MNAVTAHRGPDGVGVYENENVTLGHNRLAIIDTSARGAQPMQTPDGSLVITYNGELYNYRELRKELRDYTFITHTDTEVILAAYARWGIECVKRFNGIFSFALWDASRRQLFLVRDPVGVKPLYYAVQNKVVFFSSEIKALLEAGIPRTLDRTALSRFLYISDVLGPATLFAGIRKVPPAHYAVVNEGTVTLHKYWEASLGTTESQSSSVWHERIRSTLDEAVTRQLISDRPVGVFLSGGIDSSAVLASVMRAEGSARTYTTRFEIGSKEEDEKFNRDAHLARRTASFFGTRHSEIVVERKDIISLMEKATWHLDEPNGSATAIAQLAIAQETVRDVAVVLGGDGGDELFGGYERYRLSRYMDLYQQLPGPLRKMGKAHSRLGKLNTPPGLKRFALFHFTKQHDLARVLSSSFRSSDTELSWSNYFPASEVPFLEALMDADRRMLADGSLLRADKLSMAAGLEARVPLLDMEMVQLASRIPANQKVSLFSTKTLFKDAMRDRLPSYLFTEEKRGWFAPAGLWLRQPEIYAYAKEVLSPSYYEPTRSLFAWEGITHMLEEHHVGHASHRALIWTLLSFQLWARRFGTTLDVDGL